MLTLNSLLSRSSSRRTASNEAFGSREEQRHCSAESRPTGRVAGEGPPLSQPQLARVNRALSLLCRSVTRPPRAAAAKPGAGMCAHYPRRAGFPSAFGVGGTGRTNADSRQHSIDDGADVLEALAGFVTCRRRRGGVRVVGFSLVSHAGTLQREKLRGVHRVRAAGA